MSKTDFCRLQISDKGSIKDIPKLLTKHGFSYKQSWLESNTLELFISKAD